jgi:hypothetical protein
MNFALGISSATALILYPEFDYTDVLTKIEQVHRLENGDMYRYKTGVYDKFKFKLRFFPESDASVINSWWESNTELMFWVDSEVSKVMLTNKSKPIGQFQKPYTDLMQGIIMLEGYIESIYWNAVRTPYWNITRDALWATPRDARIL